MALGDFKKEIYSCVKCGACRSWYDGAQEEISALGLPLCPSGVRFGFESYFCKGRLDIAKGLIEKRLEWNERLLSRIYNCTLCGACDHQCYQSIVMHPGKVLEALRADLLENGLVIPEHQDYLESTGKYDNPFSAPKKERLKWAEDLGFKIKDLPKEKAEVLLYVGCMYGLESNVRETTKTFAKILNAAGVDFGFLGTQEKCCGIEQCKIGERGMFAALAEDNIEMFNGLGIKTLVTPCPHCYNSFKEYYPTVGEFNFEALHITQYMKRLIDEGKIQLQELPPQAVTYSDPCNLGRSAGEYDAPREILKAIKGIELREMNRNRDSAWCCGAGGGVLAASPDFATWTAGERIKEAEATGASVLATTCPWCEYNLETGIEIKKSGLELIDVADLVWQSMKKEIVSKVLESATPAQVPL